MSQFGPDARASDRERQATVRALRGQLVEGRLSDATFVRRLFLALDARRRGDLDRLVADLPARRPLRRWFLPPYRRVTTALARFVPHRVPALSELSLPPVPGQYVIGRSEDVDMRLDDLSVSRRHAVVAYIEGHWIVADLGSRNGTWLNGWRLPGPAPVRAGDVLGVGSCRFRVIDRRLSLDATTTVIAG